MNKIKGFTLIELMIVVAIIGILTAIALPSYRNYILASHRTAAINAIMNLAAQEARYYTTNNNYTSSLLALGYSQDTNMPIPDATTPFYYLSVASASASTFSLQAVPQGSQANDTACGTFTYDALGNKGVSSGNVSTCWKQ